MTYKGIATVKITGTLKENWKGEKVYFCIIVSDSERFASFFRSEKMLIILGFF